MPLRGLTCEYLSNVRLTFSCAHSPNRSGTMAVAMNRVTLENLQLVSDDQSKVSPPCVGPPAPGAGSAVLTKPADGILPFSSLIVVANERRDPSRQRRPVGPDAEQHAPAVAGGGGEDLEALAARRDALVDRAHVAHRHVAVV